MTEASSPAKRKTRRRKPKARLQPAIETRRPTLDDVAQHWAMRLLGTAFLGVVLYAGRLELRSIDHNLQQIQKDQVAVSVRITRLEDKMQTIDEMVKSRLQDWEQLRKHYQEAVDAYNNSK